MAETGSPKAEAPIENVVEDTTSASPAVATEAAPAEAESAQTADLQEGLAEEANGTPNDDSEEPAAAQTDLMSKSARKKAAKAAAAEEAAQVRTAPSTDADAAAAGAADSAAPATTSSEPAAADDVEPSSADSPAAPAPATPATTGSVSRTSSAAGAAAAPPKRASSSGASAAAADSSSPSPAAAAAPMERGSSAGGGGSGGLDELADAPKVKALREQLSQNGTIALTGGVAQPAAVEPKPEAPAERRLSTHDKVNTTNALELLQSGTFKLVPGQDTVPYDKLMGLRLEDGIDVTRKEEYLSGEEFATVFKMEREAFIKLPQWKRLQLKKNTQLF